MDFGELERLGSEEEGSRRDGLRIRIRIQLSLNHF